MVIGLILFIAWMALEFVVVLGSIVWSVEQGQWKDIEKAKYTMLEDCEPAPWPGREKKTHELPQAHKPAQG